MFILHCAILVTSVVRYAQGDTRLHIYMAVSRTVKTAEVYGSDGLQLMPRTRA
jgi:hypothetical protein